MALTPRELTEVLRPRLRDALYKRIGDTNDTNRTGEMMRLADDLEIALSTLKTRVYGETLPDMAEWVALCLRYPGLQHEVLRAIADELERAG